MNKVKDALLWIVTILNRKKIPFQISGGFAAKIYGSPRPLNDIDIDIPDDSFLDIYEDIKPYLIYGPDRYIDGKWDVKLATLNYKGQEIDIAGANSCKISNKARTDWIILPCDFSKVVYINVFGIEVPVISKDDLVAYKKELDGEHQITDIEAIGAN